MIGFLQTVSGTWSGCTWYGVSATGASMGGYGTSINQQNFLPKTTFAFTPGTQPDCLPVTNLTVSNVTDAEATITWNGTAPSYAIYNGTTPVATVTTTTYTFTGLTAATNYVFGVQAICSATDSSIVVNVSATTECADVTTLPYNEGFENGIGCWSTINGSSDGQPWSVFNCAGLSSVDAHGGSYAASSWSWSTVAMHADAWLISPKFVLPNTTDSLTFAWWEITSSGYPDHYSVVLSTNVLIGVQSVMRKDAGLTGMYYDYAMAAPFMAGIEEKQSNTRPFEMLILGMGTGTYGSQCLRYYPGMKIEGVEIDEKISRLAREYFAMPEEMAVSTYDGRAYLNAVDRQYDVIMVDAYQDITIPFQMSSLEFFTMVREHLREDGVMVVNMNMRGESEDSINRYLSDTIGAVFPELWMMDVPGSTNRVLFAAMRPGVTDTMERNIALCADSELRGLMQRTAGMLVSYTPGDRILTDDRAPVELLGMRVIDELIRDELAWVRQIYEEYGIEGVISSL